MAKATKKYPGVAYDDKWEKMADQIARDFAPEIYPCQKCGYPVPEGYCCTFCGTSEPR